MPALPAKLLLRKSDLLPLKPLSPSKISDTLEDIPVAMLASKSSTGSPEPNTGLKELSRQSSMEPPPHSINSSQMPIKLPKLLVQLSRLLVKTWNGLLVKPGKVLNGAITLHHAKLLLRNTA
jgi:hypothetical protein